MTRGVNLTAAQLAKLMNQAPQKLDRALRTVTTPPAPLERDIENSFDKAMIIDHWRPMKQEQNFSERKKKSTGEPGMCDKLYLRYLYGHDPANALSCTCGMKEGCACCQVLWIEWKRIIVRPGRKDKASKRSAEQATWQERERNRGALVWSAGTHFEASVAGAAKHYLESGLCRRREVFEALLR